MILGLLYQSRLPLLDLFKILSLFHHIITLLILSFLSLSILNFFGIIMLLLLSLFVINYDFIQSIRRYTFALHLCEEKNNSTTTSNILNLK